MIDIEVCANSVQSAIVAEKGGAVRVELCANLADGGTTPAKSQIELTRESVNIQLNVIIRPRGGDFLYDDIDFETMKRDINLCGDLGCDGVVIGILDADGNVDKVRNSILIDLAKKRNMSVTFHRAFDRTNNLFNALEDIIELDCDRVLTSGGFVSAIEGKDVLKNLVSEYGHKIKIMAGSGINKANVAGLVNYTNVPEIHGTFQKEATSNMKYFNSNFNNFSDSDYKISDLDTIQSIYSLVNL